MPLRTAIPLSTLSAPTLNILMLIPLPYQPGTVYKLCQCFKNRISPRIRYGEVFWTMMDPVPLNADLVERFKDKTMAIVGYETDQARIP